MTITLEDNDTSVNICLREPDYKKMTVLKNITSYLLYDENGSWLGFILTNIDKEGRRVEFPLFHESEHDGKFFFIQTLDKLIVFFDPFKRQVAEKRKEYCDIYFNNYGLFSIEYELESSVGNVDYLEEYMEEYFDEEESDLL
jgi:hypothetical protein